MVISSFTLHSIEVMLLKRGKRDILEKFLNNLVDSENIFFYPSTLQDEMQIFRLFKRGPLDFDDSFQYYIALKTNCMAVISYDSDFDNLEIERKIPEELLK